MPKVSVIVPVYNGEKFIEETIESVLNQSFSDFELIVINDGSNDGTVSLIEKYSDERILLFSKKNEGVSVARNFGFEKSKGIYIAFLDADDLWENDRLISTVLFLDENDEYGLVHTACQCIDEKSNKTDRILIGKEGWILGDLLKWEEECVPGPCTNMLIRREVFKASGMFDPVLSTAADQDIMFRLANITKIGLIDRILGYYRIHGNNMHMNIKKMEWGHRYAYDKALKNGLIDSRRSYRSYLANLYWIFAGDYWVVKKDMINAFRCAFKAILFKPSYLLKFLKKLS